MTIRTMAATAEHLAFRSDALALLKKHSGHLSAAEMLALSAHLVGQIVAMQDQRTMTSDRAMAIISSNIERGNQEVIEQLAPSLGNA